MLFTKKPFLCCVGIWKDEQKKEAISCPSEAVKPCPWPIIHPWTGQIAPCGVLVCEEHVAPIQRFPVGSSNKCPFERAHHQQQSIRSPGRKRKLKCEV
jgi:hypothetical protein